MIIEIERLWQGGEWDESFGRVTSSWAVWINEFNAEKMTSCLLVLVISWNLANVRRVLQERRLPPEALFPYITSDATRDRSFKSPKGF
jgi:hypothetical protein